MVLVDKSKKTLSDQALAADAHLLMKCHIPPSMDDKRRKQSAFEVVKTVDHQHHRLSWINIDYPSWALRAERWQTLVPTPDGRTKYETWEVFSGILAYVVKWYIGKDLEEAFTAFATGLKEHSERR